MPLEPPKFRNDCFALPQGINWMPVSKALRLLRNALSSAVTSEYIETEKSRGRILAKSLKALRSSPPVSNSAVDGYGFAYSSLNSCKQKLKLEKGFAAAGKPFISNVKSGSAVRVYTGAPLPSGVDTVVLEEDTNSNGNEIAFHNMLKTGANTRKKGEDINKGDKLLKTGLIIRAPEIALLISVGINNIRVYKKLKVGVFSTGNELVQRVKPETSRYQISDSNKPMLMNLLKSWNVEAIDLGHIKDNKKDTKNFLTHTCKDVDVLISSGGASSSNEDFISQVLNEYGVISSWRVAIKPGRPILMGTINNVPFFGLPGNPVAAFVCALIFTRPALSMLSGAGWVTPQSFMLPTAFSKQKKSGRREFLRARINRNNRLEIYKSEGSGRLHSLSWATGLVDLPSYTTRINNGDMVKFIPYSSFGI